MNLNPRTVIFAIVAIVLAGGTAFLVRGYLNNQRAALYASLPKEGPKAEAKKILVARKPLPPGLIIKPEHFTWQVWPEEGIADTYFVEGDPKKTEKTLLGAVLRRPVGAKEPITDDQVVKPGDRGFLAAVLTPGMRAISVPVNATSGISGFVFPGDRVDMILSHTYQLKHAKGGEKETHKATETILTDVRVLAVDQKTTMENGKAVVAKTATIEVDARQAEIVALADAIGKLSLSLRSLRRTDLAAGEVKEDYERPPKRGSSYTRDSDVSRVMRRYEYGSLSLVTVIRGSKVAGGKTGE